MAVILSALDVSVNTTTNALTFKCNLQSPVVHSGPENDVGATLSAMAGIKKWLPAEAA